MSTTSLPVRYACSFRNESIVEDSSKTPCSLKKCPPDRLAGNSEKCCHFCSFSNAQLSASRGKVFACVTDAADVNGMDRQTVP
eukprot:scaffold150419_cov59-Attheya_sp.AAC.7